MSNKLYLVKLKGMQFTSSKVTYGFAYVVAEDLDSVYKKVRIFLDNEDIGFPKDRELESINLLAEDFAYPDCGTKLYV